MVYYRTKCMLKIDDKGKSFKNTYNVLILVKALNFIPP